MAVNFTALTSLHIYTSTFYAWCDNVMQLVPWVWHCLQKTNGYSTLSCKRLCGVYVLWTPLVKSIPQYVILHTASSGWSEQWQLWEKTKSLITLDCVSSWAQEVLVNCILSVIAQAVTKLHDASQILPNRTTYQPRAQLTIAGGRVSVFIASLLVCELFSVFSCSLVAFFHYTKGFYHHYWRRLPREQQRL